MLVIKLRFIIFTVKVYVTCTVDTDCLYYIAGLNHEKY